MPLAFLLDENLRGHLWNAIRQHNKRSVFTIDATRVGDPPSLPLGTLDLAILAWAEQTGRLLVTLDESSIPGHLADHIRAGHHSPGVLIVRSGCTMPEVITALVLVAYASDAWEWVDQIKYIP